MFAYLDSKQILSHISDFLGIKNKLNNNFFLPADGQIIF